MTLEKLKQKIDNTVPVLKSGRDRLKNNLAARDETRSSLRQAIDHQELLQRELSQLETASPVDLQRRGLTSLQAVKDADKLKENLARATDGVRAMEGKSTALENSIHDDSTGLPPVLNEFNHDVERYLRGRVVATMQSWIDKEKHDVLWSLDRGEFSSLFPTTTAAQIVRDRIRRTSRIQVAANPIAELLLILDEILSEPIPELARHQASVGFDERGYLVRASA